MALLPTRHQPRSGARLAVTIVCGPPGSGKSTFVARHARPWDLVVDLDAIYGALSLAPERHKPPPIQPFAYAARDAVLARLDRPPPTLTAAFIITGGASPTERRQLQGRYAARVVVLPRSPEVCIAQMVAQGRDPALIDELGWAVRRWHDEYLPMPGDEIA